MKRAKKITKLRETIDKATKVVDVLVYSLELAKESAISSETAVTAELDEATEEYEIVKAGYKELQSRCDKTIATINKILGE